MPRAIFSRRYKTHNKQVPPECKYISVYLVQPNDDS